MEPNRHVQGVVSSLAASSHVRVSATLPQSMPSIVKDRLLKDVARRRFKGNAGRACALVVAWYDSGSS